MRPSDKTCNAAPRVDALIAEMRLEILQGHGNGSRERLALDGGLGADFDAARDNLRNALWAFEEAARVAVLRRDASSAVRSKRPSLIIAISSRTADGVLSGEIGVILRRHMVDIAPRTRAFLFDEGQKAIVGECAIARTESMQTSMVPDRLHGCVDHLIHQINTTLNGVNDCVALLTARAFRYRNPIPVDALKSKYGLDRPHSYLFAPDLFVKDMSR